MYFLLRQIPLVRLAICFAAGIVAGIYFESHIPEVYLFGSVMGITALTIAAHHFDNNYRFRWVPGLAVLICIFVFGLLYTHTKKLKNRRDYFEKCTSATSFLLLHIDENPAEKARSFKTIATVKAVINGQKIHRARGNIQLYISKNDSFSIKYGDLILIRYRELRPFEAPKNPHEFDYKRFMSFRNTYHQAFLKWGNYRFVKHEPENLIKEKIIGLNVFFSKLLREHVTNPQSLAIASSLLLGNREYLDYELRRAYSSSGAMHVLAVSGLHVGILFLMTDKLLFLLNRIKRWGQFIKSLLTIVIIWLYAILTGFSPSVQRAAIMFSLISAGQQIKRTYNIYNILAGSAFLQLCLNPFAIMEVSFQLSYAAVLGILMFHQFFYNLIFIRNKILDYFWQITCVSVAAQLTTFPIGLLYFHQFPVFFFVSNIVVIPAALGIMLTGMSMFILSAVPYAASIFGKILNAGIILMNKAVFAVEKIPYSLIEGLSISVSEAWLIYSLVFIFFIFIHYQYNKLIVISLVIILTLLIKNTVEHYKANKQVHFIVYHTPKGTYAYDFICGKENLLLASDLLTNNYNSVQFHILHNWWENRVAYNHISQFDKHFQYENGKIFFQLNNFICFFDKRIVILDAKDHKKYKGKKMKVNFVVLNNNPEIKLQDISDYFEYDMIIADCTNSYPNINRWKREAASRDIKFWNVSETGAFVWSR